MTRNITKIIFIAFLSIIFVFFGSEFVLGDNMNKEETNNNYVKGEVLKVLKNDKKETVEMNKKLVTQHQKLQVGILDGSYKGEKVIVDNSSTLSLPGNYLLNKGDKILVSLNEKNGQINKAYIYQFMRHKYLLYIVLFFIISMILIGGMKGLKSIITLGLTAFAIIRIFPNMLLKGYNPVYTSIIISIAITIITLVIVGGFNNKTFSAIIGTIGGVLFAGIIVFVMSDLAKLTGLGTEEEQMLMHIPQNINFDFKGLLFAGILLGALGAIMDVSMSISSAIKEISDANPRISTSYLMKSGMSVGRDIMGTMSNTLILAYVGASLEVIILLMAYNVSFIEIINQDIMAAEIVRALAGSIGLIFSIPLTVLIASLFMRRKSF